jgi:hypothetical protein
MTLRPMTQAEKDALAMGRLMHKLANNPKTRRPLINLVRAQDPAAVRHFPDQQVEDLRQQIINDKAKEKIERDAATTKEKLERQRSDLSSRYGEDRVKDIEALMTQHGLHDYELGARLYQAETPPGRSPLEPPRSSRWTMPDDKKLLEDPGAWANETAHTVINELRGRILPR